MGTKMAEERITGTVKWFSNQKGYGFITPVPDSSTTEDIFVHQSVISSEGYRTVSEGWSVEFSIGHDEDGKIKADNVTGVGGGPCTGPRHPRRAPKETKVTPPTNNPPEKVKRRTLMHHPVAIAAEQVMLPVHPSLFGTMD